MFTMSLSETNNVEYCCIYLRILCECTVFGFLEISYSKMNDVTNSNSPLRTQSCIYNLACKLSSGSDHHMVDCNSNYQDISALHNLIICRCDIMSHQCMIVAHAPAPFNWGTRGRRSESERCAECGWFVYVGAYGSWFFITRNGPLFEECIACPPLAAVYA